MSKSKGVDAAPLHGIVRRRLWSLVMLIQQEQEFEVKLGKRVDTFQRERDDESPRFECEKIRVTHLSCSDDPKLQPYTFGTEPEWFAQRGLVAV